MKNSIYRTAKIFAISLLLLATGYIGQQGSLKAQTRLNNNRLSFGISSENSVNEYGNLEQPFYYSFSAGMWYGLTYYFDSDNPDDDNGYALDITYGVGGDKTNEWNTNGDIVEDPTVADQVVDSSGFIREPGGIGYGTLISLGDITIGTTTLAVEQSYNLPQGKAYMEAKIKLTNNTLSTVENVRVWIGTRDDWVGETDDPTKQKGNLVDGAFELITNEEDRASALLISSGDEGVLFYTNSDKGNTVINECCDFANVINQDPQTSVIEQIEDDGSYGFFVRLNDMAPGESDEFTWYYAAGELASLDSIIADVAAASGAVSNITSTTATFTAKTSVDGKGYWMIVPRDADAPVEAEIKAGVDYGSVTVVASDSAEMTADVDKEFSITGLTPATNYDLYFVSQDVSLAFSTIVKAQFTTLKIDQVIGFGVLVAKTYGDDAFTLSAIGGASGNPITFTSSDETVATCTGTNGETVTILKAGSTDITASQAGNSTYYDAVPVVQTLTIDTLEITVTVDPDQTKIFTEIDPELTYTVDPALKDGDSFSGVLSRDAGEDVGVYPIAIGTLDAGANYNITFVSEDFEITPKPITVTADENQVKLPGEADPVFTFTYDPELELGDNFTGALSREAGEAVGTYAITLGDLSAGSNYEIILVSHDFRILIIGDINRNGIIDEGEIAGDINEDGIIGEGEIAGDNNGDGTIGTGEIAGDINGNGVIDTGEIAGDINGNGTIDTGEIAGDTDGSGTIGTGEIAGDVNGDGTITGSEIVGDINGDGTIGVGEVEGDINGNRILDGNEITVTGTVTSANNLIKLYPNPANGYLLIEMINESYNVDIFDTKGVLLINRKDCTGISKIDLPANVNGQLIVKIDTGTISRSFQVIVK